MLIVSLLYMVCCIFPSYLLMLPLQVTFSSYVLELPSYVTVVNYFFKLHVRATFLKVTFYSYISPDSQLS